MLNHTETEPTSAAQTRVTPEELAAAITRLEARKDAERRQADGTIAIGEVVQQLGLDATPEELLQEVKAGRVQQRATPPGQYKSKPPIARQDTLRPSFARIGIGLAVGTLLLTLTGFYWATPHQDYPAPSPPPASATLLSDSPVSQPAPSHSLTVDLNALVMDMANKTMMMKSFREMPEGHPFRCALNGHSFSGKPVLGQDWTLIKHGGQIYLRAWTIPISDSALRQAGAIQVCSTPSLVEGAKAAQITLPLSGFKCLDDLQTLPYSYDTLNIVDVQGDQHMWEAK